MPKTIAREVNPVQESMSNEAQVSHETEGTKSMDIHSFAVSKMFSEPYLLVEVLGEQLGDSRSMHNLLAIAVHAILLDSGFVLIDPVSGLRMDRFHLPDEWLSPFSICYSLPQLLRVDDDSSPQFTDHVVLKFQTLSHFFQVYGSLAKGGSGLHRFSLDESRFAPTLDLLWPHCFENDTLTDYNDGSINSYPKFWKIVKDGLAFPLLIDLSYTTGLSLPACFTSLPSYIKFKILESLPGADIARLECVCSEMRYLASDKDLWKGKVVEEVGDWIENRSVSWEVWKTMFRTCREIRKKSGSRHYWRKRRPQAHEDDSTTRMMKYLRDAE